MEQPTNDSPQEEWQDNVLSKYVPDHVLIRAASEWLLGATPFQIKLRLAQGFMAALANQADPSPPAPEQERTPPRVDHFYGDPLMRGKAFWNWLHLWPANDDTPFRRLNELCLIEEQVKSPAAPEQGLPKRPKATPSGGYADFTLVYSAQEIGPILDALESRDVERLKRIAELEGQLEGNWISVQEGEPYEQQECLTWSAMWGLAVARWQVKGSYRGFDWNGGCAPDRLTTHWQPLSAPPSEIAKGEER